MPGERFQVTAGCGGARILFCRPCRCENSGPPDRYMPRQKIAAPRGIEKPLDSVDVPAAAQRLGRSPPCRVRTMPSLRQKSGGRNTARVHVGIRIPLARRRTGSRNLPGGLAGSVGYWGATLCGSRRRAPFLRFPRRATGARRPPGRAVPQLPSDSLGAISQAASSPIQQTLAKLGPVLSARRPARGADQGTEPAQGSVAPASGSGVRRLEPVWIRG